jgi:hypothetical protein
MPRKAPDPNLPPGKKGISSRQNRVLPALYVLKPSIGGLFGFGNFKEKK